MRLRPIVLATLFVSLVPAFTRAGGHAPPAAASATTGVDADAALAALKGGNARFAAGESTFPHLGQERRCETTDGGQHPIASILSCADSRVPPELLFDAGLGDLFVIRVAGNVASTDEIGTLEYGAGHLGTRLIVVMGHSKCGAVTAVVKHADVGPNIARLVAPIAPAVDETRSANPEAPEAKLVNLCIKANVRRSMQDLLEKSPEIRGLVQAGTVKVVGAVYDIHNGTIDWLGEHPDQLALLGSTGDGAEPAAHDEPAAKTVAHAAPADPHGTGGHEPTPDVQPIAHRVAATPKAVAGAHGEPADAHAAPAARVAAKPMAAKTSVAAPKAAAGHESPASNDEKPSSHDGPDAHGGKAAAHGEADEGHDSESHAAAAAEPTKSLVAQHGLLVPAAFMAAGSALSGTLVYAIKGKRPAAAPEKTHGESHAAEPHATAAADGHATPPAH